ncbi:hypothetical protein ACIREE_27500 [Streptomyces sp. NPDC102467]|uniref:hypothetical protein n=1 Tax=Streptomyces sp. NPDC102467 TaxID=3366179 RepID=UPI00380CB36D
MHRSTFTSRRRTAMVATAALLSLGLLTACGSESSDTGASKAHASDSSAKSSSDLTSLAGGDAVTAHTVQFSVDGGTEALADVTELKMDQPTEQTPSNKLIPGRQTAGTVTVVRGAEQSQQFTDLINGNTQPATASLIRSDAMGNATQQYTLQEPRVIKVENPQTGNAQSVTIHFTNLTIG